MKYLDILYDRINRLFGLKKFALFILCALGAILGLVFCIVPKLLYKQPAIKGALFLCTVVLALTCWCILLSTVKRTARNVITILLLFSIPLSILQLSQRLYAGLMTPESFHLISSESSPNGEHLANSYGVLRNDDGTTWIRVYLADKTTNEPDSYRTRGDFLYEDTNSETLTLYWISDDVLVVNERKYEVMN